MSEKLKKFFLGDFEANTEINEEENAEENTQEGRNESIKIIFIFIAIVVILIIFGYFGYVKPEKELMLLKAEECVIQAMKPIESALKTAETEGRYATEQTINSMKGTRDKELKKCLSYYDSSFFLPSKKRIAEFNIDVLVKRQEDKIKIHIKTLKELQDFLR